MPTTKIKIKSITIHRAEGPTRDCVKKVYNTLMEAEKRILDIRRSINHDGYDKCDFVIEFEDGNIYQGRYDAHSMKKSDYTLTEHVKSNLEFHASLCCPSHMTKLSYEAFLNRCEGVNPGSKQHAIDFLNLYSLED